MSATDVTAERRDAYDKANACEHQTAALYGVKICRSYGATELHEHVFRMSISIAGVLASSDHVYMFGWAKLTDY